MSKLPIHIELDGYGVKDNCLAIAGKKLSDVFTSEQDVPAYIYSMQLIEARISMLRQLLPNGVKLHYAMKANPYPELVDFVSSHVDGIDVASAGELAVAIETNTPREEISFAGPGKTNAELHSALDAGIVINVESAGELDRISDIAASKERRAEVALRVNPDFELKSSGMKMSGGPKPFGIDAEQVPDLLKTLHSRPVNFQGFHIFTGSQNLNPQALCDAQNKSVQLAIELSEYAPNPPRFFNIGGGFGIPYFPGDKRLDLSSVVANLARLKDVVARHCNETAIVLELGRYLVGEAGIYVCRVIERKTSRGHTFLVADGGLHHHLSASGNFGQVIRKNYPVLIGNRVHGETLEKVSVVGPLCTPLDIIADKVELPRAQPGDLVVVFQSGAYGYTASPRSFLSHPEPDCLLI